MRVRLALRGDRQCRNFQTYRLASLVPGPEPERSRAMEAIHRLSLVGRVETFDETLADLQALLTPIFPDFSTQSVRANVTQSGAGDVDDGMTPLLMAENADDLAVLEAVAKRKSQQDRVKDSHP